LNVCWLEKAIIDIEEAYDFILLDNPQAAENEINKVLEAVKRLSENPAMGKAGRVAKTRELVVAGTPYILIYRAKGNRLEILRIFHGARQWPDKKGK
jgi:toxin ParE1/3/4